MKIKTVRRHEGKVEDFTFYPIDLLHDNSLSMGARFFYGIILTRSIASGECDISDLELSQQVGHTTSAEVAKCITELVMKGYLIQENVGARRRLRPTQVALEELRAYVAEKFGDEFK